MKLDPDNTNVYDEEDSNNIGYFIKKTYKPLVESSLPGSTNITLPTVKQISAVDNIDVDVSSNKEYKLISSWLKTTNYYTKTTNTGYSYYIWGVYGSNNDIRTVQPKNPSNFYGVRPVITTLKTNLLNVGE